jgi:hypothetical protein
VRGHRPRVGNLREHLWGMSDGHFDHRCRNEPAPSRRRLDFRCVCDFGSAVRGCAICDKRSGGPAALPAPRKQVDEHVDMSAAVV